MLQSYLGFCVLCPGDLRITHGLWEKSFCVERWPCGIHNILQGKHVLNCLEAQCNTVYLFWTCHDNIVAALSVCYCCTWSA